LKSITEGRKSRHLDLLDVPLESSDLVYVVCSMPPYRLSGMGDQRERDSDIHYGHKGELTLDALFGTGPDHTQGGKVMCLC
jgi:hypothetical protein